MSVPTARKYLRAAALPSELKAPRDYRTRPNPFLADWSWVEQQLVRGPALQAKTLFTILTERSPERYTSGQLRSFQRHVARPEEWQATPIVLNPPALAPVALALIAEIHGRSGGFPALLHVRPVEGSLPTRYEIAEVVNLQALRLDARGRR